MAKNNDSLSGFLKNPSRVNGQNISKLLAATNLVTGSETGAAGNSGVLHTPGAQSGLRALSLTSKISVQEIKFGNAPGSALTSAATGSQWTNLLKQTASGNGISSLLGGSLHGLGGIGSIISGITSLFGGGNKNVPALAAFRLPDSQEHVVRVRAGSTNSASMGHTSVGAAPSGVYGRPISAQSSSPNVDAQWFLDNSNNIAQAVKSAMLNSSSLNDVVSEV